MRPSLLLLAVLALAPLAAGCGPGEPDHLVATPPVLDFGTVVHGDVVERALALENRGTGRVLVTDVIPNCKCFEVLPFRRTLDAGERREVRIRFVTERVPAMPLRGKKIDVLSDDPGAPRIEVPIEGTPFQPYTVAPPRLELDTLDADSRARERTVRIRAAGETRLEVSEALQVSPPEVIAATVRPLDDGADVVVTIRDDAPAGEGRLHGWISVPLEAVLPDGTRRVGRETIRVEGTWP